MKAYENAIVTVSASQQNFCVDMELPTFMLIDELEKKLLEALRVLNPTCFTAIESIAVFFRGNKLAEDTTLAASGVWDGATLDILSEGGGVEYDSD